MAYATGSGSSSSDLLVAIKNFAVSQGWTAAQFVPGSLLRLSKGICFVNIGLMTVNVNVFSGASGGSTVVADHCMTANLSTSFNTSSTTTWGQPNSPEPVAPLSYNFYPNSAIVNDLAGPFSSWFMFSGNGSTDPDYIHVVVRTASDRYTHFSFGMVDQKSLSHAGAAYVMGHNGIWYQDAQTLSQTTDNYALFNKPSQQPVPFAHSHKAGLYIPNAMPSGGTWSPTGMVTAGDLNSTRGFGNTELVRTYTPRDNQNDFLSGAGNDKANSLLDPVNYAYPSPYSGFAPFFALPAIVRNISGNQLCCVGDFPNVRLVNMQSIPVETEVLLGTDTWKIFPVMRYEEWVNQGIYYAPSTGVIGLAYKKNA